MHVWRSVATLVPLTHAPPSLPPSSPAMSLNPNAPSFDPTAKPFIPSFYRSEPEAFVPPVYNPAPQFHAQLRNLAVSGPMSNDDVPLLSGFKRTSKPAITSPTPPADDYETPRGGNAPNAARVSPAGQSATPSVPSSGLTTGASAGAASAGGSAAGGGGGSAGGGGFTWRPPQHMTGGVDAFPTRPLMHQSANAAAAAAAAAASAASTPASRMGINSGMTAGGMPTNGSSDRLDADQPPIMGWSSGSGMRRRPSTSPSGTPLAMQQQPQQTAGPRYTAAAQVMPAQQPVAPSMSRQQDRGGLSLAAAPFSPTYGTHPHPSPGSAGNGAHPQQQQQQQQAQQQQQQHPPQQRHSPGQVAPLSQRPLPQSYSPQQPVAQNQHVNPHAPPPQQQQQQAQQQPASFPPKAAPVLPRSAQAAAAAAAAAAAEGSRGASPNTVTVPGDGGNGLSGRYGSQQPRGPSPPSVPVPRSEALSQQLQLQQQQLAAQQQQQQAQAQAQQQQQQQQQMEMAAARESGAAPLPRQTVLNAAAAASVPPRISSAPMARAVRVGVAGGSAAYPTVGVTATAPPYPGPTRGVASPGHAAGAGPQLPRAPPSAVSTHGSSPPPPGNSSNASGSPPPAPAQMTASPAAPSPLPRGPPLPQQLQPARGTPGPASPMPSTAPPASMASTSSFAAAPPVVRPAPAAPLTGLTGWRPPQLGRKAVPTNANPLVVMIFGCRGSGKTTQAENIAERYHLLHLSSGDLYKEGKQPYAEVEQAVRDHFGPDAKDRSYNGIVLDRFVATGEMDAYYLQAALNVCQLPVPIVFWLQLDPAEGMKRAQARGDKKEAADYWRYVEQRAQAEVADRVYKKIGVLHMIDCNALEARRIWERIHSIIDGLFPKRSRNIRLPVASPLPGYEEFYLLDDYSDFLQLTKEVHAAIGNTSGRTDSVPLSTIGGYVDATSFANRVECRRMSSMYVTLKVDGQRFLVVKHSHFGVLGFPFLFTGCYDFNVLFDPLAFPNAFDMIGDRTEEGNGIEWMLDAEMSTADPGSPQPQPLLHIIDLVYFGGRQGKRTPFAERYDLLRSWFQMMVRNTGEAGAYAPVVLKEYAPINELPRLLPSFEEAPFAIDGIVFQSNSVYKFGPDKFLLKWKPLQLCTADFRLMNGEQTEDGVTVFDLYTTDNDREVAFPAAVGVFTDMQVRAYQLRNSVIVELELADVMADGGAGRQPATQWVFHRLRADKPRPNKTAIVESIVNMKHLTYQELVDHCKVLRFSGPSGFFGV